MFSGFEQARQFIQEQSVRMIDLIFSDLWGRWHHVSIPASQFTESLMRDGVGFDGSSVGLKSVKSGDMVLIPDLATGYMDPFWDLPTLSFICSAYEADTKAPFSVDPRNIAIRAEAYLRETGIATKAATATSSPSTAATTPWPPRISSTTCAPRSAWRWSAWAWR